VTWAKTIENATIVANYLSPNNTILVRMYTNESGNFTLHEDYLHFDVYGS